MAFQLLKTIRLKTSVFLLSSFSRYSALTRHFCLAFSASVPGCILFLCLFQKLVARQMFFSVFQRNRSRRASSDTCAATGTVLINVCIFPFSRFKSFTDNQTSESPAIPFSVTSPLDRQRFRVRTQRQHDVPTSCLYKRHPAIFLPVLDLVLSHFQTLGLMPESHL